MPSALHHVAFPLRLAPPMKDAAEEGLEKRISSIKQKFSSILFAYFLRLRNVGSGQLFVSFEVI